MTMIRVSAELFEERLALLGAEAPHAAALGDTDVFHDAPSLHLADAGQRLQHGHDLQLADDVVAVRLRQRVREGDGPHLELLLQLGAGGAGLGCLLQRRGPLFRSESGRVSHARHPSAGSPAGWGMVAGQTSRASAAAAAAGSAAAVTARPITRMSAPASRAARGVAGAAWSWAGTPA